LLGRAPLRQRTRVLHHYSRSTADSLVVISHNWVTSIVTSITSRRASQGLKMRQHLHVAVRTGASIEWKAACTDPLRGATANE
jgi:hypothetical protein